MRAKRISNLLSLSLQLYLLSKDEKFREDVGKLTAVLKRKATKMFESMDSEKQETLCAVVNKASEMKEALQEKLDEAVVALYGKMNIAHTTEIDELASQIDDLKSQLTASEERLSRLEEGKS